MVPYSEWKVYGPYITGGRAYAFMVHPNGKRRASFWSRYVMELHLGRYLEHREEVHHKDEDVSNDSLDNLEVIGKGDHVRLHKQIHFPSLEVCPYCDKLFELTAKQVCSVANRRYAGYVGPFCSPRCAGRYGALARWGR